MSRERASILVARHGRTMCDEAGITLRDKPSPLWRLTVLTLLLSARISAQIALASARELSRAGWRTPARMTASTWQQRVDALGRGGYRRYDERTSTQLGEAADLVRDRWHGDLRRLHGEAGDDSEAIAERLQELKGVGPAGASIFLREVQSVWPGIIPYADALALDGAKRLGLPADPSALCSLLPRAQFAQLVAGCVHAARDDTVVDDVRRAERDGTNATQ